MARRFAIRQPMTPKQFDRFALRVEAIDCPCRNGHLGCSDIDGGLCFNEEEARTAARYGDAAVFEIL